MSARHPLLVAALALLAAACSRDGGAPETAAPKPRQAETQNGALPAAMDPRSAKPLIEKAEAAAAAAAQSRQDAQDQLDQTE